jgi:N-acetyl-anhydromuramyl-L-alanine amidase AmpD
MVTARDHIKPGPQNHISQKGCPSIAYHDFIDSSGTIFRCNNYSDITWHAGLYNSSSIGIVMAFKGQDNIFPAKEQWDAMIDHVVDLALTFRILPPSIIGHREVPGMAIHLGNGSVRYRKVCPGMVIDLKDMRKLITKKIQEKLYGKALYFGVQDGTFGPVTKAGILSLPINRLDCK